MDNNLFVSKYQLELPKKEDMEYFLEEQIKEIGNAWKRKQIFPLTTLKTSFR